MDVDEAGVKANDNPTNPNLGGTKSGMDGRRRWAFWTLQISNAQQSKKTLSRRAVVGRGLFLGDEEA